MKRPHYAWIVCLGGALSLFTVLGLGLNVFSIYLPDILQQNGFTNTHGSWITTTRTVSSLCTMLVVNQLCARFGLRNVMTAGNLLVAASYLTFSVASRFFHFCIAASLMGIGYCCGSMVPLSLLIGRWFRDRRAFALGLASAGSGISTILAPTVITKIKTTYGLDQSFRLQGLLVLAIAALVWLLIRSYPADKALQPYCQPSFQGKPAPVRVEPPPLRPAQKWAILLAAFLVGGPGHTLNNVALLYRTEGYDDMLVAVLFSYIGFTVFVGKILCGHIYDHKGGFFGNFYSSGMMLASLILCCMAPTMNVPLAFLAATTMGLGLTTATVSPTRWANDLYGDNGFESAVRTVNVVQTLGSVLLSPVPGLMADRFGSYVPTYFLFTLLLTASMAILQFIYHQQGLSGRQPLASR